MKRVVNLITPNGEDEYRKLCEQACIDEGETPKVQWKNSERHVFYCDLGMTKDMDKVFNRAKEDRYDIRWLPDKYWNEFNKTKKRDRVLKI